MDVREIKSLSMLSQGLSQHLKVQCATTMTPLQVIEVDDRNNGLSAMLCVNAAHMCE